MSAEEPVTSPDQHKPSNYKIARIGAVATIVLLLMMICGNHRGLTEDLFLIGFAVLLAGMLVGDWLLRKNGLKSER